MVGKWGGRRPPPRRLKWREKPVKPSTTGPSGKKGEKLSLQKTRFVSIVETGACDGLIHRPLACLLPHDGLEKAFDSFTLLFQSPSAI